MVGAYVFAGSAIRLTLNTAKQSHSAGSALCYLYCPVELGHLRSIDIPGAGCESDVIEINSTQPFA